ncbi:MAG: diguanylate cyclase [Vicinamibacterales bacterium]
MRILIADDDPITRRLLKGTLEPLGHEVVSVTNGTDALEGLLRDGAPQLAVLDWMMPGADGLTVCRTMRARPDSAPYVYIILLTAKVGKADMVEALDAGADDFLMKPFDAMELRVRLHSGERVLNFQKRLIEAKEALRYQATHDNLTGLWNRGLVLETLDQQLSRARRSNDPLTIAMADLDHFKLTNDTYGHAAGDAVLLEAAQRIKHQVREGDLVGRYGGEEFLLVLPSTDAHQALQVADRVRAAISGTPMRLPNVAVSITASFGLASTADIGYDATALLQAADTALYEAKALGRDRVHTSCPVRQHTVQMAQ